MLGIVGINSWITGNRNGVLIKNFPWISTLHFTTLFSFINGNTSMGRCTFPSPSFKIYPKYKQYNLPPLWWGF